MESLDLLTAIRLLLIAGVGAAILVDGVQRLWIDRALAIADEAARRAELLASSMRMATVVAGVVGFTTFGELWRNPESEILGRLPIPPESMYLYRLLTAGLGNLWVWFLALVALWPVFLAGLTTIGLHCVITITVTYIMAVLWGLYWHMAAGAGVANPDVSTIKQISAGGVTSPERALLLYSPMFAVATAFGVGFLVFLGLDGFVKGTALGPVGVGAGALGLYLGVKKGRAAFMASFYDASAALADGEALDAAFTAAEPEADFFGERWLRVMPGPMRPFARRDLRQAWRRNRIVPWAFVGLSAALALFGPRLEVWLPAVVGAAFVLAGTEAFRLARLGSDAPWFWLTLPASTLWQYLGRLGAALLYPVIVMPGAGIALFRSGAPLADVAAWLIASPSLTLMAVNISLLSIGGSRGASALYLLAGIGALVASGGQALLAGALSAALGLASLVGLARLRQRLAQLEAAR